MIIRELHEDIYLVLYYMKVLYIYGALLHEDIIYI